MAVNLLIPKNDQVQNYADLQALFDSLGATEATLKINKELTLTQNTICPSTISIEMVGAGKIITNGFDYTQNGPFNAPLKQVFDVSGGGNIVGLNTVYPEWWGITGSSDNIEISYAGNSLTDGGQLIFQDGKTYICDAAIVFTDISNLTIKGKAILDFSALGAGLTAITIQGSLSGISTTATANINKIDTAITVADETGFTNDKMILITSTEDFGTAATYTKGELSFTKSTAANTINLSQATKDDYTIIAETITITEVNQIENIKIKNIQMIGAGTGNTNHAIKIIYGRNCHIDNCYINGFETNGYAMNYVENGNISYCSAKNIDATAIGYSYQFGNLTQNSSISYCHAEHFRHAFTTSGLLPVWNCNISYCKFSNNRGNLACIDPHANAANLNISHNIISDSYIGIGLSGKGLNIIGNTITGATYTAINPQADCADAKISENTMKKYKEVILIAEHTGTLDNTITIENNTSIGVQLQGANILHGISTTRNNVIINGNTIINHSPGIRIQSANNNIKNNEIKDIVNDNDEYGIHILTASATGNLIKNNKIWSNITPESTKGIFIVAGVEDTLIIGNKIYDLTGTTWIDDSGTRSRIFNNWFGTKNSPIKQNYSILGTIAGGITNGTTDRKSKNNKQYCVRN